MSPLARKSLNQPETVRRFPHGHIESVALGESEIGRWEFLPGWHWANDVKPIVGTDSCQNRHVGVCVTGILHVRLDDGTELEIGPNDAYEIPPGHDGWVVGDQPFITYEWTSSRVFARAPDEDDAIVVTLLFTDIVGSTATLERVGDKAWHDLLTEHNAAMREQIAHHRGREFDTSGDGFMVVFEGAARAVRCGRGMIKAANALGLHLRVGCHTGEVIVVAGYAHGVAVHTTARVVALAGADEIFVSATTRDLLNPNDFALEPAGSFELKGLTGAREVFRVQS
ncbi:MAG TPA: adenylate/guanylate cyclase domain-containing protein [Candidatus Dormibacteraeota bacterium]|nr:adenylate/guanylate cyclase domain-containing protein [Candidatus Dormibacteraeota bacterium]